MPNMSKALKSFQEALLQGQLQLQRGTLDQDLWVHLDRPARQIRLTYVRLQGKTVTALVVFAHSNPIQGLPCFQIGYAVPKAYQRQGRAKDAVAAAIAELKYGFAKSNIPTFYIEAIVEANNKASQHVAAETISATPVSVVDHDSGLPALQYVRLIDKDTV